MQFLQMQNGIFAEQSIAPSLLSFKIDSPSSKSPSLKNNSTPNFCCDDSAFVSDINLRGKGLFELASKNNYCDNKFKSKIKQQILGNINCSKKSTENGFSMEENLIIPQSGNTSDCTKPPKLKVKLLELDTIDSILKDMESKPIVRKLFPKTKTSNDLTQNDGTKSPNIRERCLMDDKIFNGYFNFNLPIPLNKKRNSPESEIANPFKDLNEPSELELDYSRSPIVMMRRNSYIEENSDNSLVLSKKDSINSFESRFETEFEVLEEIGNGHFGVIKRCRNKLDGLEYAVKITKHKWTGEYGKLEALQEVFALSALSVCGDNPYIVKYFNGWIEDSKLYIVVFFVFMLD